MADDRLKRLEERPGYVPGDLEQRVFARCEQAGVFHAELERLSGGGS